MSFVVVVVFYAERVNLFLLELCLFKFFFLQVLSQGKLAFRPVAEVKPYPAGLQLGWVTLKNYIVLNAIFFFLLCLYRFNVVIFISDSLDPSLFSLTVSLFFLRN